MEVVDDEVRMSDSNGRTGRDPAGQPDRRASLRGTRHGCGPRGPRTRRIPRSIPPPRRQSSRRFGGTSSDGSRHALHCAGSCTRGAPAPDDGGFAGRSDRSPDRADGQARSGEPVAPQRTRSAQGRAHRPCGQPPQRGNRTGWRPFGVRSHEPELRLRDPRPRRRHQPQAASDTRTQERRNPRAGQLARARGRHRDRQLPEEQPGRQVRLPDAPSHRPQPGRRHRFRSRNPLGAARHDGHARQVVHRPRGDAVRSRA